MQTNTLLVWGKKNFMEAIKNQYTYKQYISENIHMFTTNFGLDIFITGVCEEFYERIMYEEKR